MPDLNKLPKAEIHCHLEGAILPELALQQAAKYKQDVSSFIDSEGNYAWHDFTSFLEVYDLVAALFRTPEDYALLSQTHFECLASQGAIYGEVFTSADHGERMGMSYEAMTEAVGEGIKRAKEKTGIEGRIIASGVRHLGVEAVVKAAQLAVKHPHPLVTGFGMAGDERMGLPQDFKKAFEIARDGGLALTCHGGEFGGPESVRLALDHLGVARIGHGVRAIEDPELVKRIADEGIVMEVCPVSNISLGLYPEISRHPISYFVAQGCKVTISSDDPPFFHTNLQNDYCQVAEAFGYRDKEMMEFTKTSIEAAFVDEETRQKLLAKCVVE